MHIREAIQSDYEHLTDNSISMGCYRELPERIHYAYALEDRNRPIMLGGIVLMTPTTAWCWMDWTQEAKDRARDSYRIVRDWLDEQGWDHEPPAPALPDSVVQRTRH